MKVLAAGKIRPWNDLLQDADTRYTYRMVDASDFAVQICCRDASQRLDADAGLYFYSARYYDPGLARFTQPDTLVPNPGDPQSLNRYTYTGNNPVRYADPSGHAICVDEFCDIVFGPRQRKFIPRGRGATVWYYQGGLEMVQDWFTESGPQTRYYGESAPMTQDLMRDEGVEEARVQFYSAGESSHPYTFTNPKQPAREAIQWLSGEDKTGIGSVMGSYTVMIEDNGDGTITIWVKNVVSRESGTRLLGYATSVEETVASGQVGENTKVLVGELQKLASGDSTLAKVRRRWPRSVLNSTTREQPSSTGLMPGVWGGNMEVWFMWTEPLCVTCN